MIKVRPINHSSCRKNPVKYYKDLLWTYNLPEFIQEKAQVDTHAVMETMRNTKESK